MTKEIESADQLRSPKEGIDNAGSPSPFRTCGPIPAYHERIIRHLVRNHEISIEPELWRSLNQNLDREEIKKLISLAIDRYRIPPSLTALSAFDAKLAFHELLQLDALSLIKTEAKTVGSQNSLHDRRRLQSAPQGKLRLPP